MIRLFRYLSARKQIFTVVAGIRRDSSRLPLWGSMGTGCAPMRMAAQYTRYHSMLLGIMMPTLSLGFTPSFCMPEPSRAVISINSR